jgi:hypothetical protein
MPDLRPEPLGGISAADFRQILGTHPCSGFSDRRRFRDARVILPQPALRVEVGGKFSFCGNRHIARINRNRARSRAVHADANDLIVGKLGFSQTRRLQGSDAGLLQHKQIVRRALPREMVVSRIQKNALMARRVVHHRGADLPTVRAIHHHGSRRVGPVIQSNCEWHDAGDLHQAPPGGKDRFV